VTTTTSPRAVPTLAARLERALAHGETALDGLERHQPVSRHDRLTTLLTLYDLHLGPLSPYAALADHPAVAALKWQLERQWIAELGALDGPAPTSPDTVAAAIRAIAARGRLHPVYKWLADAAPWPDVVRFLNLEGGPDGGFDDLVALCQVGLTGRAKVELATNYWDEMGNGDVDAVHTTLHARLAAAIGLTELPRAQQPASALERVALGGLLSTNRFLQPEMIGALGLTELEAGPRCRMVLRAFDRCQAPAEAYPFYREHADVDPRHGKDWLDNAVVPLLTEHPQWGAGMLRGAWWRSRTNTAFFDDAYGLLTRTSAAA
jgi:hypothetical protein